MKQCEILWLCTVETDKSAPCYHHYHNCNMTRAHNNMCRSSSGPEHTRKPTDFWGTTTGEMYAEKQRIGWS